MYNKKKALSLSYWKKTYAEFHLLVLLVTVPNTVVVFFLLSMYQDNEEEIELLRQYEDEDPSADKRKYFRYSKE